jgi:hypothetical protein
MSQKFTDENFPYNTGVSTSMQFIASRKKKGSSGQKSSEWQKFQLVPRSTVIRMNYIAYMNLSLLTAYWHEVIS